MSQARSAQAHSAQATAQQPASATPELRRESRSVRLPGEDLSLNEMLRVMDVARELRRNRELAEEMFRRDEVRDQLRDKLMRSAQLAGDRVTAAEIDAAIDHYLKNLHTYSDPPPSLKSKLAHAWVYRRAIVTSVLIAAATAAGFWMMF